MIIASIQIQFKRIEPKSMQEQLGASKIYHRSYLIQYFTCMAAKAVEEHLHSKCV